MMLNAPLDPIRRNPAHMQGVGGVLTEIPTFSSVALSSL